MSRKIFASFILQSCNQDYQKQTCDYKLIKKQQPVTRIDGYKQSWITKTSVKYKLGCNFKTVKQNNNLTVS